MKSEIYTGCNFVRKEKELYFILSNGKFNNTKQLKGNASDMTDDLSANTLEAVRKSMTVMSFMIIVYYFAGGHIPNGEIAIKLPLSNVTFENPERLMYALWLVMAWWVYRYFVLGAYDELKGGFRKEWEQSPRKYVSVNRLIMNTAKAPEGGCLGGVRGLSQNRTKAGVDGVMSNRYLIELNGGKSVRLDNELTVWRIRLVIATSCPSFVTFALPLILIVVAATLTII